jgi:hypothetical protein
MNYDILLIISLSILLSISTFISTQGLIDNRYKGLKKIQKKGWKLILLNLLILLLLVVQYVCNEHKSNLKDTDFKKQQELRDKILKNRYDSSLLVIKNTFDKSNIEVITTISDVLGKYGYKLDSTNELVRILNNSSKNSNDPILHCNSIKFLSKKGDNSYYEFSVASSDAGSTGFDIKFYIIGQDKSNKFRLICSESFMGKENKMFKDSEEPLIVGIRNDSVYSIIYFRLIGTYMNADKTKSYPIDEVCSYRIDDKCFSLEPKYMREFIIDFIKTGNK